MCFKGRVEIKVSCVLLGQVIDVSKHSVENQGHLHRNWTKIFFSYGVVVRVVNFFSYGLYKGISVCKGFLLSGLLSRR